uniref:Paf1 complex subunit Cdc73 N-terminal domain-containing protein n=1 Tax=Trichobilharzia regenti TaxID=157069 RepID=A0AA85JZ36_TRIRE|nr:unnamed protein product [Trichobilharzia regenti]
MADVLSLLREYHLNGKPIVETQAEVIFGDFAWPKTTKTNFLVWGSGKEGTAKDYYTLDCVVYLLKHIDLPHTQYVRQAASAGLPVVRLPDRRDLLAYLKGETNTAPNIDRAAPVDISLRRAVAKQTDAHSHIRRVLKMNVASRFTDLPTTTCLIWREDKTWCRWSGIGCLII